MPRVVNVVVKVVATVAGILLLPSFVFAQATIAGVIRDASAAVLPGVSVEAASPVLIEKARTVVSDGTGQYRITDLPPGSYVLTFTLTGFTTVRREGLVVSGSGVVTANADLRVGAVAETVTVSAASPVVDTQSVRREVVLNNETLSTLPATRGYGSALATVPALNIGGVAGAGAATAPTTPNMMFFTAHGGASGEGRILTNGMAVAAPFGGGGVSDVTYDTANSEEMQVLISGGLAEAETGGPSINIVPKSGGNQFRGSAFSSISGDWATGNNVDERMQSYGITQPPALRSNWDVSGSIGGPLKQDRLWFFANVRAWANAQVVDGIFANKFAGDASHWDYQADQSIEARIGGVAENLRGPPDGPADAAQSDHVLARLPAPVRRLVADAGRRRLPHGRQRLDRFRTDVRRRYRLPGSVPRVSRLPVQHDAGDVLGPAQQPRAARGGLFAFRLRVRAVRHGGAGWVDGPDSGHGAERHLRPDQPLLSRRIRSAGLRLQRQRCAPERLAGVDVLRDRRAQREGRATRATSRKCTTGACRTTSSCDTRSTTRSPSPSRTSCRRAGISTTARRRSACTGRTNGRSGA